MLFLTTYGPEIESIYNFIEKNQPVTKKEIFSFFLPSRDESVSTFTLDEGLLFLLETGLIVEQLPDVFSSTDKEFFFKLEILRKLSSIKKETNKETSIDHWYMGLIEELFIKKNKCYVSNVHFESNKLPLPLPLNQVKIDAWKRTLEFLGIGRRFSSGFWCTYHPSLLSLLGQTWGVKAGPLEDFFRFFELFLPCINVFGDIPPSISIGFDFLQDKGSVRLSRRSDLPKACYYGERKLNWIEWRQS